MKTPDKIKKGLECCAQSKCGLGECSYYRLGGGSKCIPAMCADALALIQQLQSENAEQAERIRVLESRNNALYHTILGVMHFVDKWLDDVPAYDPDEDLTGTTAIGRASQAREIALQAIEQLQAERDAAVEHIKRLKRCADCKHATIIGDGAFTLVDCPKRDGRCSAKSLWEWRGVQKEE